MTNRKRRMRRISQWLTRHSIVWQATFLFGIVIVIPALLIGGVFLTTLRQSSIQEADRSHRQYLQQMKRSVEENMQKAENLASQILFGQELQYFLKNDPPIRSQEKITFAINSLQGSLLNAKYTFPNLFYQTIVYTPNQWVNGQKEHILYESVPKGSMLLVASISLKQLTQPLYAVTAVTILAIAAGMAIVLGLSRLLAKNLFKRLTTMEPVIENMEQGNFSLRMDAQGEDEIAHNAPS